MKIVLFGPERRIGAWQNNKVIDLNRALANYLRDQRSETNAQAHADEKIPLRLDRFIALGKAAIEDANAPSSMRPSREKKPGSSRILRALSFMRPGPSGASPALGATTPRTSPACGPGVSGLRAIWRRSPRWPKKKVNGDFGKIPMRLRDRTTRFPIRNAPGALTMREKLPS